ncbi:unnamed protein product [Boreogadus saida]
MQSDGNPVLPHVTEKVKDAVFDDGGSVERRSRDVCSVDGDEDINGPLGSTGSADECTKCQRFLYFARARVNRAGGFVFYSSSEFRNHCCSPLEVDRGIINVAPATPTSSSS